MVEVAAPEPVAIAPVDPIAPEPLVFDPASVGQALPAPTAAAPAPPKMTPKPVVVVQPTVLKRSPVQVSNPADGVVVRRNVVINVGAGQPPVKGTINPGGSPAPPPPTRPRVGAHYAVRDGGGFVAGNRARIGGRAGAAARFVARDPDALGDARADADVSPGRGPPSGAADRRSAGHGDLRQDPHALGSAGARQQ